MLTNFKDSFPGCKVIQTHCRKFGKNEKILRKLKSLIIVPLRRQPPLAQASLIFILGQMRELWIYNLNPISLLRFYVKCSIMSLHIHRKDRQR